MIIYKRAEELAKEKGLSFSFISEKLGMARTYLSSSMARNNNIPNETIAKIADILETSYEYLVGETDEKNSAPTIILDRRTKKLIDGYEALTESQKKMIDSMIEEFSKL